jgi:hypothetical protein
LLALVILWTFALVGTSVLTRKRTVSEWLLGSFGFFTVAFASFYFFRPQFALDESAMSKWFVYASLGFAVGCGALSGKPWGKRVIKVASTLLAIVIGLIIWLGNE